MSAADIAAALGDPRREGQTWRRPSSTTQPEARIRDKNYRSVSPST
jgi:hypothetical protein